ncbi:amidohydrolase family protein [bacterium BMS3Abin02]|nr:amidohydrolase family protein [bacterium BMS3Abin02]
MTSSQRTRDLVIAWHGDDPWATPVSPIYELFSLVTRGRVADDRSICEPPDWMTDGGVSVEQGLAMMTTGSAYAIRQEDVVGSPTPGKYADLLVLSDNLLTVPSDQIPNVELLMTMIGGTTEFCARGAEQWCPGFEAPEVPDVSASLSRADHGPELAFDGSVNGETFCSSGADAPQWIQVQFPESTTIAEVRFIVFQNPPSDTVHELEVRVDGDWSLVETFQEFTTAGDVLTWTPATPLDNVQVFKMTTLESLSWPEWCEIEIDTGSE